MNVNVYLESLRNTVANLPLIHFERFEMDDELKTHYADEIFRLAAYYAPTAKHCTPEQLKELYKYGRLIGSYCEAWPFWDFLDPWRRMVDWTLP